MAVQIGCYEGNGGTGAAQLAVFNGWFGRAPDVVLDFIAFDSWASFVSDAEWMMGSWTGLTSNLCVSVPLCCNDDPSLANVAAGLHDAAFRTAAAAMQKAGFTRPIIRLGWEFDGNWYPWGNLGGADEAANCAAYIAAFQHVVTLFRAALPNCQICWCHAGGSQQIAPPAAYPGSAYVDGIGFDAYARGITYGQPSPSAADCETYFMQGWQFDWVPWFAVQQGKWWCVPELGLGDMPVNGVNCGSGDDGPLASWVVQTIGGHAAGYGPGQVAFVNIWDYDAADDACRVSTGERPHIAAAYKTAWGGPGLPGMLTALGTEIPKTNTHAQATLATAASQVGAGTTGAPLTATLTALKGEIAPTNTAAQATLAGAMEMVAAGA